MSGSVKEWLADRIAAAIVGVIIGVVIGIGVVASARNVDVWWVLAAAPITCGVLAVLFGDRALAIVKAVAGLDE